MPTSRTAMNLICALAAVAASAAAAPTCGARAGSIAPTVVELYTSEGCSSCPPADRWLSSLSGRSDVLTLAFHVDYWDRLGWVDRFATPQATARQYELAQWAGSKSVYTPQVVVDGRDTAINAALPMRGEASPVTLTLRREGETVTAQVTASTHGPARLEGYWAVLEDGHHSRVRGGENAGATLHHDSVVRWYRPVAAWSAAAGQRSQLSVSSGVVDNPRRVVFVVIDAATHRPLQAVALGC